MQVTEARCLEALNNIKRMFDRDTFKKMHDRARNEANHKTDIKNDDSRNEKVYSLLFEIISEKCFIRHFNRMHGFNTNSKSVFIDILNKRCEKVNADVLIFYFNASIRKLTLPVIEAVNSICICTRQMTEVVERRYRAMKAGEDDILSLYEKMYHVCSMLLDQNKLTNSRLALFNLKDLINAHKQVRGRFSKIYKPYKDSMHLFRESYSYFLTNKEAILDYFVENEEVLKETFFRDKKHIDTLFMKPVSHFFGYISAFQCFRENCFIVDERCYLFVENSFREIIGMANENRRRIEGNEFLEAMKSCIEGYQKMMSCSPGNLLFYHEEMFIFRRNKRHYLILFFENGVSMLLRENKSRLLFLEFIPNECIKKCKVLPEEGVHVLKVVWKLKQEKEMVVIPFEDKEKADRITDYIEKQKEDRENRNEIEDGERENDGINKYNDGCIDLENKEHYVKTGREHRKKSHARKSRETMPSRAEALCDKEDIIDRLLEDKLKIDKSKEIEIPAKVEYGKIHLLIKFKESESLETVKKRIFARIGKFLCPEKKIEEKFINLEQYRDVNFHIRENDVLYQLENKDDLEAAILIQKSGLDIVIEEKRDGSETISFLSNR